MPIDKNAMPFRIRAFDATGMTQAQMADLLGIGLRTVQRWVAGQAAGPFFPEHYVSLAQASFARDPEFAEDCAKTAGTTLEDLGLRPRPAPPPPPAPPLPPPPPPEPTVTPSHADAIVCAAADVQNVPPRAVRAMVAAAFARAHELGYSVKAVAEALSTHLPKDEAPAGAAETAGKAG